MIPVKILSSTAESTLVKEACLVSSNSASERGRLTAISTYVVLAADGAACPRELLYIRESL